MTDSAGRTRSSGWALALGAVAAAFGGAGGATAADPLDRYAWQARPLLIIGVASDPAWSAQVASLEAVAAQLSEREMPLILVDGDRVVVDGRPVAWSAVALRDRVGALSATGVTVALFGKDQGLKLLASAPVAPEDVFALVDGMPMRRREMRERASGAGASPQ